MANAAVMGGRTAVSSGGATPGVLLALGSAGVVATSIFYGMSPPAAAMPAPVVDLVAAAEGAVTGAATMRLAGQFGVAGDLAITAGAFLIAARLPAEAALDAAGWVLIGVSTIIFTIVDTIVGFVLPPLAASGGASPSFLGIKQIFDALFLVGTATFGAGAVLATLASAFGNGGIVWRLLALLAFGTGAVALVTAAGSLGGISLERFVGFGILGGSAVFTLVGLQIAFAPAAR